MALRVSWQSASSKDEDVVMDDFTHPQPWDLPSSIWDASRHLSSFLFCQTLHSHSLLVAASENQRRSGQQNESLFPDMGVVATSKISVYINALPAELLGEIFAHYTHSTNKHIKFGCSRSKRNSFRGVTSSKNAANPITLGHVCGLWRRISTSMPVLWSTISVTSPKPADSSLFSLWLKYSRPLPLDLTVTQQRPGLDGSRDKGTHGILHLAIDDRARWRNISFRLYSGMDKAFDYLTDPTFPMLQGYSLSLVHWERSSKLRLYKALHNSPSLRRIQILDPWTDPPGLSYTPWEGIASITLAEIPASQLHRILSSCHKLQALSITSIKGCTKDEHGRTFSLLHLETLHLDLLDNAANMFDIVTLPSLKDLHLHNGFGARASPPIAWLSLESLLSRSGCRLSRFLCGDMGEEEDTLVNIINSPSMASIVDLVIHTKTTDITLSNLIATPTSGTLPYLKNIALGASYSTDGVLSYMIQSRRSSLKTVSADLYGHGFPLDSTMHIPDVLLEIIVHEL